MPDEGRAHVARLPDEAGATVPHRDGKCAAGQAHVRVGGIVALKTISTDQHRHLVELVSISRMIRRSDGYGTKDKTLMPFSIATVLKARRLAVAGFSNDMVVTERGKLLAKQMGEGDAS